MTNKPKLLDYDSKTNSILIYFPYDASLVEKVKALPVRKFETTPAKHWRVPFEYYKQVLGICGLFTYSYSFTEVLKNQIEKELSLQAANAVLQAKFSTYSFDALTDDRKLFHHQIEGYKHLLKTRYAILADDMGLGKSIQSLVAAKAFELPVYVICPASLQINWKREASLVGLDITVYSWGKVPKPFKHDHVLIVDEAHYAQSLKSQRTKAFLELANNDHCMGLFLLTGTPIKNGRPVNLYPLLKAIKHPLAINKTNFEVRYCNAHQVRYGKVKVWDTSGASHLVELHEQTRDTILHRTKKECLDLPPKTRVQKLAELSKEAEKVWLDSFELVHKEYQETLDPTGKTPEQLKKSKGAALVLLGKLRQAASMAKIESAVDLAQEVIEQGNQVVIFTWYTESGNEIASLLDCWFLHGAVPVSERQKMVDSFQSGTDKALVCTFGAGGVGITLTAANTVILVDRPFTPGETEQAEDRLYRIGQTQNVTSIWLAHGSTDLMIDALINSKAENIDIVLHGKQQTIVRNDNLEQFAEQLLPIVFNKQMSKEDKELLDNLKIGAIEFDE